jgi:hypothetical protein
MTDPGKSSNQLIEFTMKPSKCEAIAIVKAGCAPLNYLNNIKYYE